MTLLSPGVEVKIIDESMYGSAGAGTIPLFIIATAANKALPSGTGVAAYTQPINVNKPYLITSQRELSQGFGNYAFQSVQGTPQHGHELNEYGLQAAYSYLGIANRAYVLRADIDLNQLHSSTSMPTSPPAAGTYWFDLTHTSFGVFRANGNAYPGAAWGKVAVKVVTPANAVDNGSGTFIPLQAFGTDGDIAVVVVSSDNKFYEKIAGTWYAIGSTQWQAAHPTVLIGRSVPTIISNGSAFTLQNVLVTITTGGSLIDVINAITAASIPNISATIGNNALVITETTGGAISIVNTSGTPLTNLGIQPGVYYGVNVARTNSVQYPNGSVRGSIWIKGSKTNHGANWVVKYYDGALNNFTLVPAPFYPFDSTLSDGNVSKDTAAFLGLGIPTAGNLYVGYDVTQGIQTIRRWSGSAWVNLSYEASFSAPVSAPAAGTYWYSTDFMVDVMVGDGERWHGYHRQFPLTDPEGVILSGSAPPSQTNGNALVDNDLWINTSDLENYPALYRYSTVAARWVAVDTTDTTSPFGVIFSDARQDSGTTFDGIPNAGLYSFGSTHAVDMLVSDYVDPDAPDPRTVPAGMLLFNTRFSTYNVKQWLPNYFDLGNFDPNTDYTVTSYNIGDLAIVFPPVADAGRWVTASGNAYNGPAYMGRKAVRHMVVEAIKASVESNQDIRSEQIYFNLLAAPGYPELLSNLVTLNTDQKNFSFIVGDTPSRLAPNSNALQNWATNIANVEDNGDAGLITNNEYIGIYYPWGLSTDLKGMEIMVPPSSIAMRTIAYNDQVAYPWFPPAGFQRGIVTNASSVGYLNSAGLYHPVILNQGQRDTLYVNKINPIAYIPNRGLVVYGQKTLSPIASAMDRINVARLANFLSYNLDNMMKVFLFELNDIQTRAAAKVLVERFCTSLVSLRAMYDFLVVCDETNNTPDRIDHNELWLDLLIKPEKSIEFIYIPVRLESTGANLQAVAAAEITPGTSTSLK
jgi:hypothetical protein